MTQHYQALAFISGHPRSRPLVADLAKALQISRPRAVRLLYDLTMRGAIRRAGPLIGGHWEVCGQLDAWAPTQLMEAAEPART